MSRRRDIPEGVWRPIAERVANALGKADLRLLHSASAVAADSVYGTGEIETLLRKAGKGYVLGVAANHVFNSWGKGPFIRGSAATLAQIFPRRRGGACRLAKAPKARACMTGLISNWPISMPVNTAPLFRERGRAVS
jgi:hypothetical protein